MTVRTAIFGVILSAGALASTGCEALGLGKDSSRSRDDGRISRDDGRVSRDDGVYSRGGRSSDRVGRNDRVDDPILSGDTYRSGDSYRTGGTATSLGRLDDIPRTAVRVREGTDRLTYTADQAGRVYVYDPSADRIVYSGSVSSSDRVTMDPSSGSVLVNDRPVSSSRLSSGQKYRMYFEPTSRY